MVQTAEGFYFITNRTDHDPLIYKSQKITVTDSITGLDNYLDAKAFGYDIETNGSRFHTTDLLLVSIGDRKHQFVLDATCTLFPKIKEVINDNAPGKIFVAHNAKFDYTHSKLNGIYFDKVMDTFLAAQRINLGRKDKFNNLEDVYLQFLRELMDTDKNVRKDFLSMTPRSKFLLKHVRYSGMDITALLDIAKAQREILRQYGQWEWFNEIENGICPIVGDMELEGIKCYPDKWRVILDGRKKDMLLSERALDEWLNNTGKFKIKQRNRATVLVPDLFGGSVQEIDNINRKHINYGSSDQVKKVIKKLGYPVPTLKSKGQVKESVSEKALVPYIVNNPDSPIKPFLKKYLEFQGHKKFVTSYGLKFLNTEVKKKGKKEPEKGFLNPVTGLVYTSYKQIGAETGRFSSGNVKEGFFQSQNLPAEKPVRESFGLTEQEIEDGWLFTTCDLSGAELIIMAALANDLHLYELGADKIVNGVKIEADLHSPIATKCWKAIHDYRVAMKRDLTIQDSKNVKYTLNPDFIVSKAVKQLRTDFKPMTFGTVYGLKAPKAGQTLNIPTDEGQIAIDVIVNEFPKTIAMVEQAAQFAFADGYVIFNKVSNNRRWFTEVCLLHERLKIKDRAKRYEATKAELDFKTISEIEGAARNCRIQGTQADMIKESKLRIVQHATKHNIPCKLVLTVHDELGVKHKSEAFKDDIAEIMKNTANRYLAPYSDVIKMGAEAVTKTTWTK